MNVFKVSLSKKKLQEHCIVNITK